MGNKVLLQKSRCYKNRIHFTRRQLVMTVCAISVFATLKFSSAWVGSWSEAHVAYNVYSALHDLIPSYFSVKKENRHPILPVNMDLWNSSRSLLLLLCAMKGGTCWSYPSGRDGSSQKVKAIKLHPQENLKGHKTSVSFRTSVLSVTWDIWSMLQIG